MHDYTGLKADSSYLPSKVMFIEIAGNTPYG